MTKVSFFYKVLLGSKNLLKFKLNSERATFNFNNAIIDISTSNNRFAFRVFLQGSSQERDKIVPR